MAMHMEYLEGGYFFVHRLDRDSPLPSFGGSVMQTYAVRLGRAGGGAGTFVVIVYALTPAMARNTAMSQYPGYSAHSVKQAR